MSVRNQDRLRAGGAHTAGWLVSLGFHGSLVLGAMVLLQQMQLTQLEEPFEWNVAMVQPAATPPSPAAANESPPIPPTPSQALAPRRPEPTPAQPVPSPVVPAPAPAIDTHLPPPRTEPAPSPSIHAAAPSTPEPMPEPVREHPRPQLSAAMKSPEASPPTPPTDRLPTAQVQAPAEPLETSAPASPATSPPEPTAVPPEPVRRQVDVPQQPLPAPSRTAEASTATNQPAATVATEVAALTPPSQSNTAKPDDGWLSTLMGKWIADLEKHYPATLRLEGIQGKVVLVAMLHENGTLTDVRIAKSSGNTVLDHAAIADVEQGPPIKLSRPLGRPQRPIKFSISYDLKITR
ncbi:putative TonB protein [Nitrospira lenta]|uniref:Putative TonB protein n=1 Tax=Nitrospira lenta TaxID=1436998 RepID=A0A330L0S3_9BACT|nr:putative TonB protein [Nitrospira lenta]